MSPVPGKVTRSYTTPQERRYRLRLRRAALKEKARMVQEMIKGGQRAMREMEK